MRLDHLLSKEHFLAPVVLAAVVGGLGVGVFIWDHTFEGFWTHYRVLDQFCWFWLFSAGFLFGGWWFVGWLFCELYSGRECLC